MPAGSTLAEYMKEQLTALRQEHQAMRLEQAEQKQKLENVYGLLHGLSASLQNQHQVINERVTDIHATVVAILQSLSRNKR